MVSTYLSFSQCTLIHICVTEWCCVLALTWLPSLADTSAILLRLAWCCLRAVRVAPPATPTIACSQNHLAVIMDKLTSMVTLEMLAIHRISRNIVGKSGEMSSRKIATSFSISAMSLQYNSISVISVPQPIICKYIYLHLLALQSRSDLYNSEILLIWLKHFVHTLVTMWTKSVQSFQHHLNKKNILLKSLVEW